VIARSGYSRQKEYLLIPRIVCTYIRDRNQDIVSLIEFELIPMYVSVELDLPPTVTVKLNASFFAVSCG